eukprot:1572347-Alexandrium_andersonii.AAC.1
MLVLGMHMIPHESHPSTAESGKQRLEVAFIRAVLLPQGGDCLPETHGIGKELDERDPRPLNPLPLRSPDDVLNTVMHGGRHGNRINERLPPPDVAVLPFAGEARELANPKLGLGEPGFDEGVLTPASRS